MKNNPYDILNLFNRMLAGREGQKSVASSASSVVPAEPVAPAPLKLMLDAKLVELLGRKLKPAELSYIKSVQLVHQHAVYSRGLYTGYLRSLIDCARFSDDYLDIYPECPSDEVEFWHYLRPVLEQRGGIIPECMDALVPGTLSKRGFGITSATRR